MTTFATRDDILTLLVHLGYLTYDVEKESGEKKVKFGSTVKILDLSDNTELEFQIVGSQEADPLKGKLSNATPLGETLIGAKVGQTVTVHHVEEPYDVKILEIK